MDHCPPCVRSIDRERERPTERDIDRGRDVDIDRVRVRERERERERERANDGSSGADKHPADLTCSPSLPFSPLSMPSMCKDAA